MRIKIILAALCVFALTNANAQKANYKVALLGFYNLENFYDTIDDPLTNDAEYLPTGTKHYTGEIYLDKVGNLAKVISQIGTDVSSCASSFVEKQKLPDRSL